MLWFLVELFEILVCGAGCPKFTLEGLVGRGLGCDVCGLLFDIVLSFLQLSLVVITRFDESLYLSLQ